MVEFQTNKLVSIIVPVYNSLTFLPDCLDHLISQTYKNIEIILIDDGSTDGSSDMCDKYSAKDSRISVYHKENGGVSSARNFGIDCSKGQYLFFCDSDDVPNKKMVEVLVSQAEKYNADFLTMRLSTAPDVNEKKTKVLSKEEIVESICTGNIIGGYLHNKLFSKSIVGNIRFNENVHICEDKIFCLECAFDSNSFIFIPESYYYYRINCNGALKSKFNEKKASYALSMILEYNLLKRHSNNVALKKKIHSDMLYSFSFVYWKTFFGNLTNKKDIRHKMIAFFNQYKNDYGFKKKLNVPSFFLFALFVFRCKLGKRQKRSQE